MDTGCKIFTGDDVPTIEREYNDWLAGHREFDARFGQVTSTTWNKFDGKPPTYIFTVMYRKPIICRR